MMPPRIRCDDDDNDVDGAMIADAKEKSVRECVHLPVKSQNMLQTHPSFSFLCRPRSNISLGCIILICNFSLYLRHVGRLTYAYHPHVEGMFWDYTVVVVPNADSQRGLCVLSSYSLACWAGINLAQCI